MPRTFSRLDWKKTFRKLPPEIESTLRSFPHGTECVVGCAKNLSAAEIASGNYHHLYIEEAADIRDDFESFIPSPNVGPTSFANSTTIECIDKKRGKYTKLIRGRAPTPGRFGSHPTTYRREVWHRTFHAPAMSHIAYKRLPGGSDGRHVRVHFQIQEVINTSSPDVAAILLRCVNLLQENVGRVDLLRVAEAEADSIRRLSEDIGWDVLPDDQRDNAVQRVIRRLGRGKPEEARRVQNRIDVILALKPQRILHSTRGFVGYFVIEFCDNLTVFENLEIDHAMFVVRSRADELSRLSRSELRGRLGQGVERLLHTPGWEKRLSRLVKQARGDQSASPDEMI